MKPSQLLKAYEINKQYLLKNIIKYDNNNRHVSKNISAIASSSIAIWTFILQKTLEMN